MHKALIDVVPEFVNDIMYTFDCRDIQEPVDLSHSGFCTENLQSLVSKKYYPEIMQPAITLLKNTLKSELTGNIRFVFYCKSGYYRSLAVASVFLNIVASLSAQVNCLGLKMVTDTVSLPAGCGSCHLDFDSRACPGRTSLFDHFVTLFTMRRIEENRS